MSGKCAAAHPKTTAERAAMRPATLPTLTRGIGRQSSAYGTTIGGVPGGGCGRAVPHAWRRTGGLRRAPTGMARHVDQARQCVSAACSRRVPQLAARPPAAAASSPRHAACCCVLRAADAARPPPLAAVTCRRGRLPPAAALSLPLLASPARPPPMPGRPPAGRRSTAAPAAHCEQRCPPPLPAAAFRRRTPLRVVRASRPAPLRARLSTGQRRFTGGFEPSVAS